MSTPSSLFKDVKPRDDLNLEIQTFSMVRRLMVSTGAYWSADTLHACPAKLKCLATGVSSLCFIANRCPFILSCK